MRHYIICVVFSLFVFITVCENSDVKDYPTLADYYAQIDYSCEADTDCEVKDVHNCCGYYPECVNKDAYVDPDFVKEACEREGLISPCGWTPITGCKCVDNECEGFYEE